MSGMTVEEGADALARAGLTAEVAIWEDGLREEPRPGTLEWWYFDAHLDDGSLLSIAFMTKPPIASSGPLLPFLFAQLAPPAAAPVLAAEPVDPSTFAASRERCDVTLGKNWVRGDLKQYQIHLETAVLGADLQLTASTPPARIGTGIISLDGGSPAGVASDAAPYLGWLIPVPRGIISGTVTINGKQRAVKGTGYHDHNWGTIPFERYLSEWYWGRAPLGNYTTVFAELRSVPAFGDARVSMFVLARDGDLLLCTGQNAQMQAPAHTQGGSAAAPDSTAFVWSLGADRVSVALSQSQVVENDQQGLMHMVRYAGLGTLDVLLGGTRDQASGPFLWEHPTFTPPPN